MNGIYIYKIIDKTGYIQINGSSNFTNDLGLDSLDTVEVVMAIEEEFNIEIPDKDADAIHSGRWICCCMYVSVPKTNAWSTQWTKPSTTSFPSPMVCFIFLSFFLSILFYSVPTGADFDDALIAH